MAEAMRAQVASMLKGIDRYNPANLIILEKYVQMQIRDNLYDLEANLSVLKLYQFNHTDFKLGIVLQILLKALTNLPHTDFILCKCLLDQSLLEPLVLREEIKEMKESKESKENPIDYEKNKKENERIRKENEKIKKENEKIKKENDEITEVFNAKNGKIFKIMDFHNMLETCQFKLFWQQIAQHAEYIYIDSIVGFSDSIRKFICHVVNITYQRIEKSVLQVMLGIPFQKEDDLNRDLKKWMNKYGWKELDGGLIYIGNQEENVKTKNITEKIDFESVAAIMATSR